MANFLWSQKDKKNYHWVSWQQITFPLMEGGLNIRKLTDVFHTFKLKRIWHLLNHKGIWAETINAMYGDLSSIQGNFQNSFVWKDIGSTWCRFQHLFDVSNISWLPRGNFTIDFAWDNLRRKAQPMRRSINYWTYFIPPKISFFIWQLTRKALGTDDVRQTMGATLVSRCYLCNKDNDSLKHLSL
jgi:hypothetical protein